MLTILVLAAQTAAINAPADQYFGRFKMSALRIRYETMQLQKRYETHQLLPEQAEHLLILTQDAFGQWSRAYPKDHWLPSTGYAIAGLFAELPGTEARDWAVTLYVYVKTAFPHSSYATESRTALHKGVPVRPDPSWAKTMRAAGVPSPSAPPPALPAEQASPSPPPGSVRASW
ncbi:MAG TPA: hypothetical protein VHX17_13435 [Candidatus Cybelea sp.]|jgi:hypothetical protein|nr:hypothetical protein [Candidatus Cybelea sp.]